MGMFVMWNQACIEEDLSDQLSDESIDVSTNDSNNYVYTMATCEFVMKVVHQR